MGACYSVDENTRHIQSQLTDDAKRQRGIQKILFLGPGGSGKSTIFKQVQWLHLDGFCERDALNLKRHIYAQTINQMKTAIKYYDTVDAENEAQIAHDIKLEVAISTVITHEFNDENETQLGDDLADAVKYIWDNDRRIKSVFNNFDILKYQMIDETTEHFWNNIDRIKSPHYVPNDEDILNVRCRTTGVIDKQFTIKNTHFHLFDVGGQKSERRKWIHFFGEVKAVLFVISLASYDQVMYQDMSRNSMVDSLQLFEEIVNKKAFNKTHMILFLNKKDLFKKKILEVPLTVCPAFSGFNEFEHDSEAIDRKQKIRKASSYIRRKFHELNKDKRKQIYSHVTYAMDRKNIDRVFADVHHIVITGNLSAAGSMSM